MLYINKIEISEVLTKSKMAAKEWPGVHYMYIPLKEPNKMLPIRMSV
jgi:hypothetical protein